MRIATPWRKCAIDGCEKPVCCRVWCTTHYERWRKYRDPLAMKQRPHHEGGPAGNGYWHTQIDGRRIQDQVRAAEAVLGKRLPAGAVVHHADENPLNNDPSNLVICPSKGYHALLHLRMRARQACGNADFRKCWLCKNYDDQLNMAEVKRKFGSYFYHHSCVRKKHAEKMEAKRARNVHV